MLTLEQLYKLGENIGVDIFEGISVPTGSPLDQNIIINSIMERCGMNIPMYSDVNVMRNAIYLWSVKHQYTFRHVAKLYEAEYSPIENKDYYTSKTTERERDLTDNTTLSNTKGENIQTSNISNVTEGKTTTHGGTDTTRDHQNTSAYNASDFQPENEDITTIEHGETITDSGTGSTSNAGSSNKTVTGSGTNDKTVDDNESITETSHEHGNIGITSNVDLEKQEKEWLTSFEPYSFIAEIFENELTLFVY